jgi:hypothetical protein
MKAAKRKRAKSKELTPWPMPKGKDLLEWYVGPLTKKRLAELRCKLATARGLLVSFLPPRDEDTPTAADVRVILKATEDP